MDVAVIAPPIRMPAVGRIATGSNGIAVLSRMAPSVGSRPARIGAAVHHDRMRSDPVMRCAAVPAATATISSRNSAVSGNDRSTTTMTALTAASCSTARTAARTTSRARPTRASPVTVAAAAVKQRRPAQPAAIPA